MNVESLAGLSPLDRETIVYTLREEANAATEETVRDGFEILARLVEASGLVAGKCRVCGCTEENACAVEVPGHGMGSERACGWADETETLCDHPRCVSTPAPAEPGRLFAAIESRPGVIPEPHRRAIAALIPIDLGRLIAEGSGSDTLPLDGQ